MTFNIDRQTIEELNLPGKFRSGSVYSLFNQVKTRGGELLLDEIFLSPLQDEAAINERTDVFQFFQEAQLDFPVDAQQINLIREFLD
ncbi:MAG: MutS-related protein, partial [Mucilaginibacter sp.]